VILLGLFACSAQPYGAAGLQALVDTYRAIERSTFVLLSSLVLLLYWQWRPMPAPISTAHNPLIASALDAMALVRLGPVVRQYLHAQPFRTVRVESGIRAVVRQRTPLLYRLVRHPLYLSFLLAFWATPSMTAGHLLFAVATTGYVLIAIQLEERDLIDIFGDQYRRYRQQVAMLIP
jgi:protein-S-isoprenylcysteine O-methyltransferase Ste14